MRSKFLRLVIFTFFAITLIGANIELENYLELGNEYYKSEDYENATFIYNKVLDIDENNTAAINYLIKIYMEKEDFKKAIEFLKKDLNLNPEKKENYLKLANIYMSQEKIQEDYNENLKEDEKNAKEVALEYYEKYLELDNYQDGELIFEIGNEFFKNYKYEKARNFFEKDKSNTYKNLYGLALTSRFLGDFKRSITEYNKLIKLKPKFEEGYLGLAIAYKLNDNINDAINNYESYLKLKKNKEVYIDLARLYIILEKREIAKNKIREGLKIYPNSRKLKDLLLEVYSR
ncbi:MAG: tetratricopeptide repeat protein [Fusobacteriota bacterium]